MCLCKGKAIYGNLKQIANQKKRYFNLIYKLGGRFDITCPSYLLYLPEEVVTL